MMTDWESIDKSELVRRLSLAEACLEQRAEQEADNAYRLRAVCWKYGEGRAEGFVCAATYGLNLIRALPLNHNHKGEASNANT